MPKEFPALPVNWLLPLLLVQMLLIIGVSHAQTFIDASSRPGGIAIVDLGPANGKHLDARWNDRPVAILEVDNRFVAVVGIPLSLEPGTQQINVLQNEKVIKTASFTVLAHTYDEQWLTIANKRKVNPSPIDMERIKRETRRLNVVKSSRSDRLLADSFIWPVAGPVSSPFGLQRYFNEQPRRPHGGIDIAAPEGTPIMAAADGIVIDADEYFFNGNSVFLEHGLGLQTFYAHMSRIDVNEGDRVTQGQVIGAVGKTGRVTGPHLHWSVGLNSTWIDPLLVIDSEAPPLADTGK